MKIEIVEPQGRGGIHSYAQGLAESLVDSGHDVEVLTTTDAEAAIESDTCGVMYLRRLDSFCHQRPSSTVTRRGRSLVSHVRNHMIIGEHLSRTPHDVVHFVAEPRRWADRCVKAASEGTPTVMTVHNVLPHDSDSDSVLAYWKRIYEATDALVCHQEAAVRDLSAFFGPEISQRAAVIPLPVDSRRWRGAEELRPSDSRSSLGLPEEAFLVLCFGLVRPYKGLGTVLEALARIRDSSPNLRVVVAGSCADWHSYRVQIERLGIADKVVERIGWVNDDEVPLYFSACDVAALPYRHIDGSAVAATGAYLGVPLLLSDIPGFRATWADDEARFVQGGAESWAAVLNEVSAPPHLQDLRLRAGRARLRALHEMTWASSAAQHATVYQSAMDSFARRR